VVKCKLHDRIFWDVLVPPIIINEHETERRRNLLLKTCSHNKMKLKHYSFETVLKQFWNSFVSVKTKRSDRHVFCFSFISSCGQFNISADAKARQGESRNDGL